MPKNAQLPGFRDGLVSAIASKIDFKGRPFFESAAWFFFYYPQINFCVQVWNQNSRKENSWRQKNFIFEGRFSLFTVLIMNSVFSTRTVIENPTQYLAIRARNNPENPKKLAHISKKFKEKINKICVWRIYKNFANKFSSRKREPQKYPKNFGDFGKILYRRTVWAVWKLGEICFRYHRWSKIAQKFVAKNLTQTF